MLVSFFRSTSSPVHFIFLAIASIALLFIIDHFSKHGLNTKARLDATQKAEILAGLIADNFAKTAESIDSLLDKLNYRIDKKTSASAIEETLAASLLPRSVVQVSVVDSEGVFIASNIASGPPVGLADRAHIKIHLDNKNADSLYIGHPVTGRISNKVTVQFTKAYRNETGALSRILVASYLLNDFTAVYQKLNLGDKSRVRIVGFDGVDRIRYEWADVRAASSSSNSKDENEDNWRHVKGSESNVFYEERSNKAARVGAFVRNDHHRFFSIVSISQTTIDQEVGEAQERGRPLRLGVSIMVISFAYAAFSMRERQLRAESWQKMRVQESNLLRRIAGVPNVSLLLATEDGDLEAFQNNSQDKIRGDEVLEYLKKNWRDFYVEETKGPEIKVHRIVADNEWRELSVIAGMLPGPGGPSEPSGHFVLALDQTSFRKNTDRMYQISKLESMGELAAGLAHEISQPLGTIALCAHNIQVALQKNDHAVAADKLDVIKRQVGRTRDLINHLRRFGRSDSGSKTYMPIGEPLRGLVQVFRQQCRLDNIKFNVDTDLDPDTAIWGNCNELEQVLLNLAQNARQAVLSCERSQQGGVAGDIAVAVVASETEIVISVRDDGGGIAAENMKKIFKPFFTTKPVGEGTGLGLVIVEKIVQDHNGKLEVRNIPGGTEFRIFLPRLKAALN